MSKNNKLELSRRKTLAGIGGIGIASTGAGLGTSAFFSDQETFEDNSITAGELQLSATWQQLYYGASQEDRPGDYGEAGRPFVNAFPDSNGDGLQSFVRNDELLQYVDLDEYEDPVEAAKIGRNLEFTCEEIATFDEPSFDPNENALIELEDVKPGDSGEVTFGIKLCDNPGYIWLSGVLGEETDGGHPESDGAQLADEIQARVWYDLNGNNVFDEGEPPIVSGSLREVFEFLRNQIMLHPDAKVADTCPPNGSNGGDGVTLTHEDCEVDSRTPPVTCEDLGMFEAIKIESEDLPAAEVGVSETYNVDDLGTVTITVTKVSEDDIREFDFELDGFEVDAVIVKGGPDSNVCQRIQDGETLTASAGEDLGAPFRTAEERYGVSNISFCYTAIPDEPKEPPECFEPSNTHFIAFEWSLPTTVGNKVQGDSVAFDLSFYTEQCRHNDDPEDPPSANS